MFDGLEIAYEEVGSDTPLQKRENIFNDEVIKLDKEKDVRMQPSRALFREDQLCEQLKVPHCFLNQDRILTSVQLQTLQRYVSELRKSIAQR